MRLPLRSLVRKNAQPLQRTVVGEYLLSKHLLFRRATIWPGAMGSKHLGAGPCPGILELIYTFMYVRVLLKKGAQHSC